MPLKEKEFCYFIDDYKKRVSKDGIEFLEVFLSNYHSKRKVYLWKNINEFLEQAEEFNIIVCSTRLVKERNKIYHIVDFEFREFLLTSLEHLYGLENWDLESSLMEMLYFDITDEFLLNILKAIFNDRKTMEKFFRYPASINNHHAHPMGLIEHTIKAMKLAEHELIFKNKTNLSDIDKEIIIMALFLHDFGKVINYKGTANNFGHNIGHYYIHHADLSFSYFRNKVLNMPQRAEDWEKCSRLPDVFYTTIKTADKATERIFISWFKNTIREV